MSIPATEIRVNGIVQGVGFRPFVYRLAAQHGLTGTISNDAEGVVIRVAGGEAGIEGLLAALRQNPPPQARIVSIERRPSSLPAGHSGLTILESETGRQSYTHVSPDIATCADCRREIMNPGDRRHKYPYTKCTNCGPGYSIIGGVIVTLTHPLDYLRFLLGDVVSLWSFNGHISPLEVDVEDVAEIGLKFASGAVGGVHVNYFQRPPVHRLEIVGTGGTLRWENADAILHFQRMPAGFGSFSDQPPAPETETFLPPVGFERNQLFLAQTRHFIDVVRGESEPVCTLADGIMALRLALAAYASQPSGIIQKI